MIPRPPAPRLVALACTLAALAAGSLPPALAAVVLAIALAYVPGRALVAWLAPADHGDRRLTFALALALAPFAAGAPAALLVMLGVPALVAARAVVIAWALALVVAPVRRGADDPPQTWVVAFAWTLLVGLLLAIRPALLQRADGWFHAAVTLQVAQRGLPPEDPFFAGLRLLYFWGTHAWAALWLTLAPRIPVWAPLAALQIAAALACPLAVGVLASRLGASRGVQRLAMALSVAGLAPFAWLMIPGRILIGGVQGGAEVAQLLERGLWPVLAAMDPGVLHASVLFPGDKFLIATPFALGMALSVLSVIAVQALIETPGPRAALMLAAIQAAALWLHAVVGAAIAVAAGGWWLLSLAGAVRDPAARRALGFAPAALALAGLILFPYLRGITAGKTQSIGWGLDGATLRTWLLAGAALVPVGMVWLARASRGSAAAVTTARMTLALTAAALLAGLPLGNQSKLFSLLFVVLAAPAALGWAALAARLRVPARRVLIATLAFALVPTQLFALWGAATERGQIHLAWDRPVSATEHDGIRWAAGHTPADAVFVDGSGSLDFTVVAGRSAMWGGEAWAGNWGYPAAALAVRRRVAETLGRGYEPPADVAAMLHGLGRPVIVVARRSADDTGAWQRLVAAPDSGAARVRILYRNPDLALFAWGTS